MDPWTYPGLLGCLSFGFGGSSGGLAAGGVDVKKAFEDEVFINGFQDLRIFGDQ